MTHFFEHGFRTLVSALLSPGVVLAFILAAGVSAMGCKTAAIPEPPAPAPLVNVRLVNVVPPEPGTAAKVQVANDLFQSNGIDFDVEEITTVENAQWAVVENSDWPSLRAWNTLHNNRANVILVDLIVYTNPDGTLKPVGGFAWKGGPAVIQRLTCKDVVAHELGHLLGLQHTTGLGCNVMAGATCCPDSTFEPWQVASMKEYLLSKGSVSSDESSGDQPDFICYSEETPDER